MYTKQDLIDSIKNDHRIIVHLFEKIPAGTFDYKPTEKQRTTLELLQYLSMVTPATVEAVTKGDTSHFMPYVEIGKTVTPENFLEVFDKHLSEAVATLEKMTDDDLSQVINLFMMGDKTKGVYLVETISKWLAAYKMQLFLYIKASGNTNIGTSNLWGGMDMPIK